MRNFDRFHRHSMEYNRAKRDTLAEQRHEALFEPAICNGRIIDGTERKKTIIDSDSSSSSYSPGQSIDSSMPAARSPCSPAKAIARGTLGKRNIGEEKPLL